MQDELFERGGEGRGVLGYAQVALEQGIDAAPDGLTYAVPGAIGPVAVGDRVIVPLGRANKLTPGYVVAVSAQTDVKNVKAIRGRDAAGVSLTADLMSLARWIAAYYCSPLGMVFGTMLPAAVRRGTGTVREKRVVLAGSAKPQAAAEKISTLQRAVLEAVTALGAEGETSVALKRLADRAGARTVGPVKQLIEKGLLRVEEHTEVRSGLEELAAHVEPVASPIALSAPQRAALENIAASIGQGFSVHLLHGVTASGKTEVYLRIIEHLLAGDRTRGAIVLVPEIALTPQTVARFKLRFPQVAVLHSGLTAAQRHEQWRRIREGKANIVVGARSAVFAPLANIGVIIVDEEQESSYKQDQLPRYHARDVAVKRGQLLGVPVVLGSATPSLESYHNAVQRGTYQLHRLPERVTGLNLPKVQIVDMVQERRRRRGVHLLSGRLEDLLTYTLRHKAQAMLLLNRRGYANYIACPDHGCGWLMNCQYCDVTMVYHKDRDLPAGGVVRCHHCSAEQVLPRFCPVCRKKVTAFGLGTQRVEEELARKLKDARVLRMDSDAMKSGRDYYESLDAFRRGDIDILVGTQMIAKGLDFPNVRLVGVISADTALHLPDFRAAERTFQLIAQVAGRAGRGDKAGMVVVQTFSAADPVIALAAKHDYESFAAREMKIRGDVGLPPVTRMARIVIRHRDHAKGYALAAKLAGELQTFNRHLGGLVRLRGPMPCPIARIAEFHRQQIELIAPDAATLQKLTTSLRNARLLHADARTAVDVDPVDLL